MDSFLQKLYQDLEYKPNTGQLPIHESQARIKQVAGGERGGKSHTGAKEAMRYIWTSELIWLVGPTYETPRDAEFQYIWDDCEKLKQIKEVHYHEQGPCSLDLWTGCKVVTKSADDPQKLGMVAPDFILGCEAAQFPVSVYRRLRGRLSQKRANMVLTGTFESSSGWYVEKFKRWQGENLEEAESFSLPTWENKAIFPDGTKTITLEDGRSISNVNDEIYQLWVETPPDVFIERYGGQPCKPSGLIPKYFDVKTHVGNYSFDPAYPVEIAIDPGYGGAYAVLFIQNKGGVLYIIDEIYVQHYVTEEVITMTEKKIPYGLLVYKGAIDIHSRAHDAKESVIKTWHDLSKNKIELESEYVYVEDGIDALNTFLSINPETRRPNIFVDRRCAGLISECGGGDPPWPTGGPWLRNKDTGKEIDKNNHACKALIYFIVNRLGYIRRKRPESQYGKIISRDPRSALSRRQELARANKELL